MDNYVDLIKASEETGVPVEKWISSIRKGESMGVVIENGLKVITGFIPKEEVEAAKQK